MSLGGGTTLKRKRSSCTEISTDKVILLLDLDCFYAQCESIRLGIDGTKQPLCLLQWNSALAVNYPARAMGIERGDSFDSIKRKSHGTCISIHLPVIPVDTTTTQEEEEEERSTQKKSLEEMYKDEFCKSKDIQKQLLFKERGKMRYPSEGKASLERYRLASTMIFSVIREALLGALDKKNKFVLEKASIDELFLDVTEYCYDFSHYSSENERVSMTSCGKEETVVVHGDWDNDAVEKEEEEEHGKMVESIMENEMKPMEKEHVREALKRGCVVARIIRRAVRDQLGFTLSAGISTTKLVSKLAASKGKPDGQAVVFPNAITKIMEETKIRKVRNLGGKIGKKVLSLLPPGEETMGSIARLLSLDVLVQGLGSTELAKQVFDAARGIDQEAVTETMDALTKSITAFKSFQKTDFEGIGKWIQLLASDVISRVEQDSERNRRYPKNCTIQYIYCPMSNERTIARSIRIPFPKHHRPSDNGITTIPKMDLIEGVKRALKERNQFPIQRLGLCAFDFEVRRNRGDVVGGIDAFLTRPTTSSHLKFMDSSQVLSSSEIKEEKVKEEEQIIAATTHALSSVSKSCRNIKDETAMIEKEIPKNNDDDDSDLQFARQLQASYDRENSLYSVLMTNCKGTKRAPPKSQGRDIQQFFKRKKR